MMARWRNWWLPHAARIDAISLRERILLFVTAVACVAALGYWGWLSPAQDAHGQLVRRLEQQGVELQKARTDLAAVGRPVATDVTVQGELTEVRNQLASMRKSLAETTSTPAPQVTPLTRLLVHLLRRHDALTLIRAATMSPTASITSAPTPGVSDAALPDGLMRQGVELTVAGPYAELTRYVQTLEQALPQVRWGTMVLRSDVRPPELTLQLYVVEVKTP